MRHVSLQSGKVVVRKEQLVQEATMEFPRINYNYMGRRNKYFYALGNEYLHPNRVTNTKTASSSSSNPDGTLNVTESGQILRKMKNEKKKVT